MIPRGENDPTASGGSQLSAAIAEYTAFNSGETTAVLQPETVALGAAVNYLYGKDVVGAQERPTEESDQYYYMSRQGELSNSSWEERAVCKDSDPDLHFPVREDSLSWQTDEAKKECKRCDVWLDCLKWAVETDQRHGILGRMTTRERRKSGKRILALYNK